MTKLQRKYMSPGIQIRRGEVELESVVCFRHTKIDNLLSETQLRRNAKIRIFEVDYLSVVSSVQPPTLLRSTLNESMIFLATTDISWLLCITCRAYSSRQLLSNTLSTIPIAMVKMINGKENKQSSYLSLYAKKVRIGINELTMR